MHRFSTKWAQHGRQEYFKDGLFEHTFLDTIYQKFIIYTLSSLHHYLQCLTINHFSSRWTTSLFHLASVHGENLPFTNCFNSITANTCILLNIVLALMELIVYGFKYCNVLYILHSTPGKPTCLTVSISE